MTDRELLELAAKAAGMQLIDWNENWYEFGPGYRYEEVDGYRKAWNPLTYDSDALRLATRLCMSVSTGPCEASANTIPGALRGAFFKEETIHQCQDVAVRRVIVRAAAEVGEAMP